MIEDREGIEDRAIIDLYLETVRGVDTAALARVRDQLAAAPTRRKRRRFVVPSLPRAAVPALITICALIVGTIAIAQHDRMRATTGQTTNSGSPGGTILFSRNNHWYTIAPNGTHLHKLLSSTAGCPDFGCAVFSPDGTRIMVAAQSANKKRITTAIINTNGSGFHALPLPDSRLNLGPGAWALNGSRIALDGWDDTNKALAGIYAVNAPAGWAYGKALVRLTTSPDGHNDDALAYSPDGSRLLFYHEGTQGSSQTPGFGGLFETSATGSGRVKLNPPGTYVMADFGSPASWSPDGKQIAFTAYTAPASAGVSAVFVEDANGTHRRRITQWGEWSTSARWSPDGTVIEFDKLTPGLSGHNLFLIHPNGTGLKEITFYSPDGSCCAVWSPDGKKLLTIEQHDGFLITMNRDGSGMRRLAKDETAEYAWGR